LRFEHALEFWTWVESLTRPQTRLYIFAHNWGFDAPVLSTFDMLPSLGWSLGAVVVESPPVILSWRKGNRVIEMLDTLNWWRVSLKSLGESIHAPKLKMPTKRASKKRWDIYCSNDVEVIRLSMLAWWEFLQRYDLGGFARTLAGQAMRTYRHRFMLHPILVDSNATATALARESYHGGRTECFRIGKVDGPVHVLDVNSMYPSVMKDNLYPTILRLFVRKATREELVRWLSSKAVVAKVDLETTSAQYAVVINHRLCFPVGKFTAVLTTPDLVSALRQGHIRGIREAAVYERQDIFSGFVHEMYQLRQDATDRGDDVSRFMLKILMNSLYGKFAQRGMVWDKVDVTPDNQIKTWVEHDWETGQNVSYRQFAGIIQRLSREPEAFSSHPAIASHVTAFARRLLWNLISIAGARNVFYCDTDSLYVNDLGLSRLASHIDGKSLGKLKLEASHDWVVFHGAKDYQTPVGRKTKGVRANARWETANTVVQDQWTSLVGMLRQGQLSQPQTKTLSKTLSRRYSKGSVGRDGMVSPLRLTDW
jgi:hypothetical protein